jgi:hypothetical protein
MSGKEAGIFVRDNLNANPSIDNGALIVIKWPYNLPAFKVLLAVKMTR